MSGFVGLSVIVSTHNRSHLLQKCLAALEQQAGPEDFEVLVVADACTDNTEELVRSYAQQSPYPVKLLSHSARSASATRNLGAAYARGNTLLFLDDDIIAGTGLIQAHREAQQEDSVVLGYSRPRLSEKPSWWQYNARLWWEDTYRMMKQPGHRFTYRDFFSGNFSMPAALFKKTGGFDTSLKGRLEDYELGIRLLKAGARFRFVPEALGHHYDHTDLGLWLRRVYQEGMADIHIGERHPELRNIIFQGFEDPHQPQGRIRCFIRRLAFARPSQGDGLQKFLLALAILAEQGFRSRGMWWHLMGAAREYNYWRGVAAAIGGRDKMVTWLQEAPVPPAVAGNAPIVDITALPADEILERILEQASVLGLRLAIQEIEVLAITPQPGAEPLRKEHLQHLFKNLAKHQFVPALALKLIQAKQGVLC